MSASVIQFPVQIPFVDNRSRIDMRWLRVLEQIIQENAQIPSDGVVDGSKTTYGPMTLYQGADSAKGGSPKTGDIYFALDTGRVYWARNGQWKLLSEELTGDITKGVGSTVTSLKDVFNTPGTYGSATQTPVITVDSKGRITNLWFENIPTSTFNPAGIAGSLQFNASGELAGSIKILYDDSTGALTFTNPEPTRENLSPLTTKGDIFVRSDVSTRLPVGGDGMYLRADSTTSTGLVWADDENIEVRFDYGDATPKPLGVIPANRVVRMVSINILEAFNDESTISIPSLLQTTDAFTMMEGTYTVYPGVQFSLNTPVELFISSGSSTQGSGLVTITLED